MKKREDSTSFPEILLTGAFAAKAPAESFAHAAGEDCAAVCTTRVGLIYRLPKIRDASVRYYFGDTQKSEGQRVPKGFERGENRFLIGDIDGHRLNPGVFSRKNCFKVSISYCLYASAAQKPWNKVLAQKT